MTDESWRADIHRELTANRKRTSSQRQQPYDSARWKRLRAEFKHGADCVLCARFGLHVSAVVADHVVPTVNSSEGFYDAALQPLCLECHTIKQKIEAAWRRKEIKISELNLATSKEAHRLRAAAFGVGVDGFQLYR